MTIVKKYSDANYISNRMGLPAYDNTQFVYTNGNVTSVIYSLDSVVVGQIDYTYDTDGNLINKQRVV
jgi:hypothetical protein